MKHVRLSGNLVGLRTHTQADEVQALWNFNETGLMLINAAELAEKRVQALQRVFRHKWWVDSHTIDWHISAHVKTVLEKDGMKFLASIPPIWRYRLTTSTCQFRHGDTMHYFDAKYLPFDIYFDYQDISDGWIRALHVRDMLAEAWDSSSLSMNEYLNARGGGMSLSDLEKHPIFRAIIPRGKLRREYLTCLKILDYFSVSQRGKHSLWRPGEMASGYLRRIALGLKWETVYPPNSTTVDHMLVCQKWPNFIEILQKIGFFSWRNKVFIGSCSK